jgi:hypothetical protein
MEILLITSICAAFVGFVFGWFVGHLRNNQVLADMETALLKMEKEKQAAKDFETFADHHLRNHFNDWNDKQVGSLLTASKKFLTENDIKRQIMTSKD